MKSWAYVLKIEVAGTSEMLVDTFEDGLHFCTIIVEVAVLLERDTALHPRRTETVHFHAPLVQQTLSSWKFSCIFRYNCVFYNVTLQSCAA